MRAYERLIQYARIHTASAENAQTTPSSARQFVLARMLEQEMRFLGLEDVYVDEHCFVYGKIPASPGYEEKTAVGFLAHMDTIPDFSGYNVQPRIIEGYDGKDVKLGESGRTLSPSVFPHLKELIGKTLIVTDGTTVLGADDKAGIAEIMTMAEKLHASDAPEHGAIYIAFCPDEEIGHGAALLDLDRFGAQLAYTLDGGGLGEIEYENFNAAEAELVFHGFSVHPGAAKDTMINASLVAMEFNSMLPTDETPRNTSGYEGFFHLIEMQGDVSKARTRYIIRDHDAAHFQARKNEMERIAETLNKKYGDHTVVLSMQDQYRNMLEMIKPRFEVVENALNAAEKCGMTVHPAPIRGGTDGAQLSYRGLPCPNLPTGSYAHHGPFEHAVAEEMDRMVEWILAIVEEFAK